MPYGFNTFAIPQYGRAVDYRLAIGQYNCPYFWNSFEASRQAIEDTLHAQAVSSGQVNDIIQTNTVGELCDYYLWAHTTFRTVQYESEFHYMWSNICPSYFSQMNDAIRDFDRSNHHLVVGDWLQNLSNKIHNTYVVPSENTKVFMNWQTLDTYHMYAYASAISNDKIDNAMVPAAS